MVRQELNLDRRPTWSKMRSLPRYLRRTESSSQVSREPEADVGSQEIGDEKGAGEAETTRWSTSSASGLVAEDYTCTILKIRGCHNLLADVGFGRDADVPLPSLPGRG